MPDCLPLPSAWQRRRLTAKALILLCWARVLVEGVAFRRWRSSLGWAAPQVECGPITGSRSQAERLAACVVRAAKLLPFASKCLPQGMALSWMLRKQRIPHALVFAARPPAARTEHDVLHAWVEHDGAKIIGDLPGPWYIALRMGENLPR